MENKFKKLQVWSFPNTIETETGGDSHYWKHLQFPVTIKNPGTVTHVEFSPVSPHNYLATSSSRVVLYSSRTHTALKSHHRFSSSVYSASFRPDGQLFVVGTADGSIRVMHDKNFEQVLQGHSRPVQMTKFLDNFKVFSGSDDKTVRLWDVATKSEIISYGEHKDYVRCGSKCNSSELFITGSYDQTIKLFDSRTPSSVLSVNHGEPVESVLMYPSAGIFASAGGNVVKVWDIAAGGKLITLASNHHKTITSLCFCSNQKRIVSASLDRHVKFYDISTNKIALSLDYPSSLLSLAIAPDDSLVAVGSTDSMLTVRRRLAHDEVDQQYEEKRKQRKRTATGRFVSTVERKTSESADVTIDHQKKEWMEKYNVYLRKFQHSKALDAVMNPSLKSKHPDVAISVMQELMRRDTLKPALAGKTDKTLSVILEFLLKNFMAPYTSSVMDIVSVILDVYQDKFSEMPLSLKQVLKLSEAAKQRTEFVLEGLEIVGVLKNVMNTSVDS